MSKCIPDGPCDQRDVFGLKKHRFVQFGVLLYTKAYVESPFAAEAPGQDLTLWLDLGKYRNIDSKINFAARNVVEHHLPTKL